MAETANERGTWGRKLGFVMATAGSAIGLGNIWRFPTVAGENGGAAFLFLYLVFVVLIALPIMLGLIALGRHTQRNPVGAIERIATGSRWKHLGVLCVVTSLAIVSYYSVIAGWCLGYLFPTLLGRFNSASDPQQIAATFDEMRGNPALSIMLSTVILAAAMAAVARGVRKGIERWCGVLMPALWLILLLLVLRSVTLEGAGKGLAFYLTPDFSKVTALTALNAANQAFFSLSLGMGIMTTYGSYLSKKHDIIESAMRVATLDTMVAVIAGLAIFPALFTIAGLKPDAGPELIFLVLPNIFCKVPAGAWFGAGFFLLLTLAALTSAISLLEVPVAYLVDEWKWPRLRSVLLLGGLAALLAVPSALSFCDVPFLSRLPWIDRPFLDVMDVAFGRMSLTVSALLFCLFIGWRWGAHKAFVELRRSSRFGWLNRPWSILICFVCPAVMALLLVVLLLELVWS